MTPGTVDPSSIIDEQLGPYFAQLDAEQRRQAAEEQMQRAAYTSATQALMQILQREPAAAKADYDAAIGHAEQLGAASNKALAAANPNALVQADLSAINAPASQQAQAASRLGATFEGGGAVLNHLASTVTGQDLAAQEGAKLGYLHTLPYVAAAQGGQGLRQLSYTGSQARQRLADERAQLRARIPGLISQARQTAEENALKRRATALNTAIVIGEYQRKGQAQAFGQAATAARLAQGDTGLGIRKVDQRMRALQNDRSWKATMARLGIAEKGLELRAATAQARLAASAQNGGFTPAQRIRLRQVAGKIARAAWEGVPTTQVDPSTGQKVPGREHQSYQEAMRAMLSQGIPLVVAQQALNTFWTQPGVLAPWEEHSGEGRPLLSYQQRKALQRRRPRR